MSEVCKTCHGTGFYKCPVLLRKQYCKCPRGALREMSDQENKNKVEIRKGENLIIRRAVEHV